VKRHSEYPIIRLLISQSDKIPATKQQEYKKSNPNPKEKRKPSQENLM
jgi:hypothetical protein